MRTTIHTQFRVLGSHFSALVALLCLTLVPSLVSPAAATVWTLTDENSELKFDTGLPVGGFSWKVEGIQQLNEFSNWYRLSSPPEISVDNLFIASEFTSDLLTDPLNADDTLTVNYIHPQFDLTIQYGLDGDAPGSLTASMGETVWITNTSSTNFLEFFFFEHMDFDLSDSAGNDKAWYTSANDAWQQDAGALLWVNSAADHREINYVPNILNSLTDGGYTFLSDMPFNGAGNALGPADVSMALEWDFGGPLSIPPLQTAVLTKEMRIWLTPPVPEPASGALGAMALAGLLPVRRRMCL